jgi:hypothetical protein
MQKKNTTSKERRGDTSRTSSQGRKLASGGDPDQRGNPEINEDTKSEVRESRNKPLKPRKR